MEDFDGDGDLDLFITSYLLNDQCRFFLNDGKGGFVDHTKEGNLTGIVSGLNTIHADYDNDGDRDIFITRGAWLDGGWHPNSLLRNNGDATFTDVTIEAGVLAFKPTQSATWTDLNLDGWLDLFVVNESSKAKGQNLNECYINQQDGTFKDVAKDCGMAFTGFFKAIVAGDINGDQWPDLYFSDLAGKNKLFANRSKDSKSLVFEDITAKAGVALPLHSFPAWMFDYNNDGLLDIFVCGYDVNTLDNAGGTVLAEYLNKPSTADHARLYVNQGNETFTDQTKASGLHKVMYGMGSNFGDLDNDGWLDFYMGTGTPDYRSLVPNRMFHNMAGKRFDEISMDGFAHIQKGHGVAFGDLDNDGDQDMYTVMGGAYEGDMANNILLQNPGNTNKWLTIFLEGKTSNRDAIGAKVIVTVQTAKGAARKVYATVGTGASFGASSLRLEMGLGDAKSITSIEVIWPKQGVASTVFANINLNTVVKLTEGSQAAELVQLPIIQFQTGSGHMGHHH
jgi:FG-GAP-like repeat/ASPIC and UnbV